VLVSTQKKTQIFFLCLFINKIGFFERTKPDLDLKESFNHLIHFIMRPFSSSNSIFDTQIDANKIYTSMKHHFSIHNYSNKQGKNLIYLHLTSKGSLKRIPLDLFADPAFWDSKKGRLIAKDNAMADINLILDNIESKVTDIKTIFRLNQTELTLEKFIEEFKNGVPRFDFLTFFKYELENQKLTKHANTIKKEKSVLKACTEFKPKWLFSELDITVIDKFKAYRTKEKMKRTTINSNLKIIKKYLNIAHEKGIKTPIKLSQIKIGSTDGNRDSLTEIELNKMRGYFESSYIRDNYRVPLAKFLYSCFTGLRISDAQAINENTIVDGSLKFTAVKTGKYQKIKLPKAALAITEQCPEMFIEKHSDQHINRILKDICGVLGIKKKITFHYARHTFATNFLRQGGKVEVLQKLLNHANIKETMIYVHILQEQQDDEIMLLDNIKITKDSRF